MKKFTIKTKLALLAMGIFLTSPLQAWAANNNLGMENQGADLKISYLTRYNSGIQEGDGGTVEIVSYNPQAKVTYVVNGNTGKLTRIDMSDLEKDPLSQNMDIDIEALIGNRVEDFSYGDMTSVDYSPSRGLLAVAIQDERYNENGYVAFFTDQGSQLQLEKIVEVGVQPDMVAFNPEGTMVLTANEGEPRQEYGSGVEDPMGTISLIDTQGFQEISLDFKGFDNKRQELVDKGIILKKGVPISQDLEPEYISFSGDKAFVSLQEANAIATIDLSKEAIVDISSVGLVDHGSVAIDIDKGDQKYSPRMYPGLFGISMPDGIKAFNLGGKDYIITANEGDGREWGSEDEGSLYVNEIKEKTSPTGNIKTEKKVTYFDTNDYEGIDPDNDYLFGARSFSILAWEGDSLVPIYNSASDFESLTASYFPDFFNVSNDNIDIEDRSGKKGPEPESVTVGQVEDRIYAFIALERISGIMVYDVTNPAQAQYINYINTRDFSQDIAGDVSPEGIHFVSAQESPTGKSLLLVAMEVSGTMAVYELEARQAAPILWNPSLPIIPEKPPIVQILKEEEKQGQEKQIKAYISGYPNGSFKPEGLITRAEAVSLFSRLLVLEGKEKTQDFSNQRPSFSDIKNHWAKADIEFLYKEGYISGYPERTFGPDDKISRAEFVQMIMKYSQGNHLKAPFKDMEGHWAQEAINQSYGNKLVEGYQEGYFKPDKSITRAESVKIFNQLFKRNTKIKDLVQVENSPMLRVFSDLDRSHWAYLDILDGTNTHVEDKTGLWIQIK